MNKKLFICLFLSSIIATEVGSSLEKEKENQGDSICGTNVRLARMESELSNGKEKFIGDGMVQKSIKKAFWDSMKTTEAEKGWNDLKSQWNKMFEGSEASKVIGTIGKNLNKIFTSDKSVELMNVVLSTLHTTLSKIGEEKKESDLSTVVKMVFSLLTLPAMPDMVIKTDNLVMTVADNENAILFVNQLFKEMNGVLNIKDLDTKLHNLFTNIKFMMADFTKNGKQEVTK